MLSEDAIVEMPQFDLWLRGTEVIGRWFIAVDALGDLLTPVNANGSLAVPTLFEVFGLPDQLDL